MNVLITKSFVFFEELHGIPNRLLGLSATVETQLRNGILQLRCCLILGCYSLWVHALFRGLIGQGLLRLVGWLLGIRGLLRLLWICLLLRVC